MARPDALLRLSFHAGSVLRLGGCEFVERRFGGLCWGVMGELNSVVAFAGRAVRWLI
jgi:hypothetical protein